jgi:hypothetical protein
MLSTHAAFHNLRAEMHRWCVREGLTRLAHAVTINRRRNLEMMFNKWTLALASAGVISLGSVVQAEEQHSVLTALSQTTLSGYVDASAIAILGDKGTLPGRTFDGTRDKQGGFNLHAVKLSLEKPLDEGQWSAGYKADLVFGPDANYYSTILNAQGIGAGADADDFAVKQAYVAVRAPVGNGLDIKLGVWDTLIGYEVFESGNNPNFSRSYGYALEPTHHTGVLLSYHISDTVSISGGVANGWTGAVNDKNFHRSDLAYLGMLTVTLPEATGILAGSSVYVGAVHGRIANYISTGATDSAEPTSTYVGTTLNSPIEGLSFGFAFDYRADGVRLVGNDNNWAWAAAAYASFQATEKLRLNARADYTRGSDGTFYDVANDGVAGDKNELGSLTFTADYSLWANVITRAEARWDRSLGGDRPFTDDLDKEAVTLAANFIYKF